MVINDPRQDIHSTYRARPDEAENIDPSLRIGALTLYLDFINLFVMFLQLTGERRD